MIEIIAGTFFICACPWYREEFESLNGEQTKEYEEMFMEPEFFVRTVWGITVVKRE